MHILILAHEFPPVTIGGVATYLGQLADGLASEDVRLTIGIGGCGPRESLVEANRVVHFVHADVDPLVLGRERFNLFSDGLADEIARRCEAGPGIPDVIHCNNWFTFRCGQRLRARWDRPIVSTVHSLEHLITPRWGVDTLGFIADLERQLCRTSDRIIAVSRSVEDEVRSLHPDADVVAIHNGAAPWPALDPEAVAAVDALWPDDRAADGSPVKRVVFAGRLTPQKGLRFLLHAFRRIAAARDDLRLVVAGDGNEDHTEALRAFAATDPLLSRSTRLVGKLDRAQLRALYARAAVAVVPSLYEPFGYAATEAMAAGVPLVASRIGGLAEIIEHDCNGVLVDVAFDTEGLARIDPDALATAIVDLVDDPAKAQRLREAGLARAAEFSGTRMAERTLQAYRSACRTPA